MSIKSPLSISVDALLLRLLDRPETLSSSRCDQSSRESFVVVVVVVVVVDVVVVVVDVVADDDDELPDAGKFRMVLISPCVSSVPTKLDRAGRRWLTSASMLGKFGRSAAMLLWEVKECC